MSKMKKVLLISPVVIVLIVLLGVFLVSKSDMWLNTNQKHYDLGEKYLSEMNYDAAILEFSKAISIDDKNEDAYIGLAKAYAAKGETENVRIIYETLLASNPSEEIIVQVIEAYIESDDLVLAKDVVNELIDETDDDIYYDLREQVLLALQEKDATLAVTASEVIWLENGSVNALGLATAYGLLAQDSAVFTAVDFSQSAKQIFATDTAVYLVDQSNQLWSQGLNVFGQQGITSSLDSTSYFVLCESVQDVALVAPSLSDCVVLDMSGNVYISGDASSKFNWSSDEETLRYQTDSFTQLEGMQGVIDVYNCTNYALMLTVSNDLYAVGILPSGTSSTYPVKIASDISLFAADSASIVALKTDGSITSWGWAYYDSGIVYSDIEEIALCNSVLYLRDYQNQVIRADSAMVLANTALALYAKGEWLYLAQEDGSYLPYDTVTDGFSSIESVIAQTT